ncbi:MAG: hypothetical protein ACE5H9_02020 [Anaerolineae bacterium]
MTLGKWAGVGLILAGIGLAVWAGRIALSREPSPTAPSRQDERLIPTGPPTGLAGPDEAVRPAPTATTRPTPTPPATANTPSETPTPAPPAAIDERPASTATHQPRPTPAGSLAAIQRFGVGVPYPPLQPDTAGQLGLGWYLTWRALETPLNLGGIEFWQMVRVGEEGYRPDAATIERIARANPGATWLIGNEPDVIWQDNVTPARYAELYHELYHLLKETDPAARVAIGGITQPTPLRLQYLEMVVSSYESRYGQAMPVDVWNIHNFILREERGSWGVDIPPGFEVEQGILFELEDHDDLERFKAQIITFRQWMADHGQREKPLIVSEYGILMPEDYGFPLERVKRFMYGTYDFMLNARDEQLGYPADDNRLVQRWAWYSLADDLYPTGNFIDLESGELTSLGHAHQEYIAALP